MQYKKYLGILLGGVYGLAYRMLCGQDFFDQVYDYYNIYSISFIWVMPIVISMIPMLVAREEILKSRWKQFLYPVMSVLLFFLLALSSGVEDWLCILIIVFPFLLSAGVVGLSLGHYLKKKEGKGLYAMILLPLLLNPLENQFEDNVEHFQVQNSIVIEASQAKVWQNLKEVPEIQESEYESGILNFLGVPRPIKSELIMMDGVEYRVGYFSDELRLFETVAAEDSLETLRFEVHIDKSTLRDLPTDQHLLQSDYFQFEDISYRLEALDAGHTKLTLDCQYKVKSKMNAYASFWANIVLADFEKRLLAALKVKLEK
ncbi:MAG: SRPBCC family protein [Bacteroidota bacterium]